MFKDVQAFSSFSVDDSQKAIQFYGETLEMDINTIEGMEKFGVMELQVAGSNNIMIYTKEDHQPATFTVLNFPVNNIDKTIDELKIRGVEMLQYDNPDLPQDDKGVMRGLSADMGPDIAWFSDPAGNVLAILQDK